MTQDEASVLIQKAAIALAPKRCRDGRASERAICLMIERLLEAVRVITETDDNAA
jgi:hypothetical protein